MSLKIAFCTRKVKKSTAVDKTQSMSHTVDLCPLMKLGGGLSRLHSAYDDVVQWLANLGR